MCRRRRLPAGAAARLEVELPVRDDGREPLAHGERLETEARGGGERLAAAAAAGHDERDLQLAAAADELADGEAPRPGAGVRDGERLAALDEGTGQAFECPRLLETPSKGWASGNVGLLLHGADGRAGGIAGLGVRG